MNNFTYIFENFITWSTQGYTDIFGFFFWPLLFTIVIGYTYLTNRSVVATAVAIMILFAAFGSTGVLMDVDQWAMLMQAIVIVSLTALVLVFFSRWRK